MTVTDQFAPPVSESTYGYVTCRVIRRVGDTDEANDDDKPDVLPGVGSVRFTPVQPVVTSTDYSAYVVRETIDAPLDALGHMVRRPPTDGETLVPGLWLVVGVYDVAFQLTKGSIRGFRIEVTASHTKESPLDLVTVAPYEPPPGATVTTMLVPTTVPDGSVLIKQGLEFAGVPQEQFRGAPGRGIKSITDADGDGIATVVYSDGDSEALPLPPGQKGDKGDPGPVNKLSIGTVTTGAAGSSASASITGVAPAQTLNLAIPRGNVGAPGAVATASDYLLVGPGRPDTPSTTGGIVTGSEPVGCEYRSTDGAGVGAWVWMKRPTGWTVIDGDTGWRNVSDSLAGVGTNSELLIRRLNGIVFLDYHSITPTTLGSGSATYRLPAGFCPTSDVNYAQPATRTSSTMRSAFVTTGGPFGVWLPAQTDAYSNIISYPADAAWPTTLPGTPA